MIELISFSDASSDGCVFGVLVDVTLFVFVGVPNVGLSMLVSRLNTEFRFSFESQEKVSSSGGENSGVSTLVVETGRSRMKV